MEHTNPTRIKSITEFHRMWGLPQPEHPLISLVDYSLIVHSRENSPTCIICDYYGISIKRDTALKMIYGQQEYDFDEGAMIFTAPNQVLRFEKRQDVTAERSGWILCFHPDFLWKTPMAKTIKQYEFFNYSVHEALFLSEKEEATINNIVQNIQQEYHSNIDKFSQNIITSLIETLLNYAERFYQRQFITRKITNHKILDRLEEILADYFNNDLLATKGPPTVQYISETLNISQSYLSSLLKVLTGRSTQQHIQDKLIGTAKEKLSTTDLSVSEIAYELGFEHPQSFSKLFKAKTNLTPLEFRQKFN